MNTSFRTLDIRCAACHGGAGGVRLGTRAGLQASAPATAQLEALS